MSITSPFIQMQYVYTRSEALRSTLLLYRLVGAWVRSTCVIWVICLNVILPVRWGPATACRHALDCLAGRPMAPSQPPTNGPMRQVRTGGNAAGNARQADTNRSRYSPC